MRKPLQNAWSILLLGTVAVLTGCATHPNAVAASPAVRHIVLFAFKPEATAAERQQVEAASAGLPDAIPLIRHYEWGTNLPANARAQGYTHCMLFDFDREEDVAVYRDHPAHQAFIKNAMPHIAQLLVFDYRPIE